MNMPKLTVIRCRNPFCDRHPILAEMEWNGEPDPELTAAKLRLKCRACKEYTRVAVA